MIPSTVEKNYGTKEADVMNKRAWLSIFLVLVLGISFVAPVALAEDTIKVGGIAVLSGPYAVYGLAVQKGVDLYISQLNAQGGIDGKKVETIANISASCWLGTRAEIKIPRLRQV